LRAIWRPKIAVPKAGAGPPGLAVTTNGHGLSGERNSNGTA